MLLQKCSSDPHVKQNCVFIKSFPHAQNVLFFIYMTSKVYEFYYFNWNKYLSIFSPFWLLPTSFSPKLDIFPSLGGDGYWPINLCRCSDGDFGALTLCETVFRPVCFLDTIDPLIVQDSISLWLLKSFPSRSTIMCTVHRDTYFYVNLFFFMTVLAVSLGSSFIFCILSVFIQVWWCQVSWVWKFFFQILTRSFAHWPG